MKTITLPNGKKIKAYKPHEAAEMLGYNTRSIRAFLKPRKMGKKMLPPRLEAINTNKGGKQPVWWIPSSSLEQFMGV